MFLYAMLLLMTIHQSCSTQFASADPFRLKIKNLNGLSSFTPEYDEIFAPHYINKAGDYLQHNVHATDEFGKFLKLKYSAKHPSNIRILKMDEKIHKTKIDSLSCNNDINNTISLHFKSHLICREYLDRIQTILTATNKKYFITAGHEWFCVDTQHRSESILREITYAAIDETNSYQLILHSKPANLLDIFEDLDLEFETNVGLHQHKLYRTDSQNGRKLLSLSSWWDSIWPDITDTISGVMNRIESTIEKIATASTYIIEYVLGDPIDFNTTSNYFWSWNYNESHPQTHTFDLSNTVEMSVECTNCYTFMNLTYLYKLHIQDSQIKLVRMILDGNAEINFEVASKVRINTSKTISTPELAIPDFSISVAGFKFGLFIHGQIEIGTVIDIDMFAFQFNAAGHVIKGVEYDRDQGTQNYINQQNFQYNKTGPKIQFQSANIMVYMQPILYLTLEHVGSIYFGVQPKVNLAFDTSDRLSNSNCAAFMTPSVSLMDFIGVNFTLFNWNKKIPIRKQQSTLPNWAGCIDQAKITQIQTVKSDVTYSKVQDSTNDNEQNFKYNKSNIGLLDDTPTYIDTSYLDNRDIKISEGWGLEGTQWWANMSTIPDICSDYSMACGGYDAFPILSPDDASLMIHVIDEYTLIGIYHTFIEVTPNSGWNLENMQIYTNISCVVRHKLTLQTSFDYDDIPTYNVEPLEWDCDTDLNVIGIDEISNQMDYEAWLCMITLPPTLDEIQLNPVFGNIMLFDRTWCQVFSLTKKPQYTLNYTKIENIDWNTFQYPSRLWYGIWNCHENISIDTALYFIGYNHRDQYVEAIFETDSNETFFMDGIVDLMHMTMKLRLLYNYQAQQWIDDLNITFIGLINILFDGTITYSGTIDGYNCTGFVFQGYLNMTQFDDDIIPMNTSAIPSTSTSTSTSTLTPTSKSTLIPSSKSTLIPTSTSTLIPTSSPISKSSTTDVGNMLHCKQQNNMLSVPGLIMFIIGMGFTLIIMGIVWIIRKYKNNPKPPINFAVQLADDEKL